MANNELQKTEGKIRLRLPDDSYKDFNNKEEAQKWLDENKYYIVSKVEPKEAQFPEQNISAPPVKRKGIDYLQGSIPYLATPSDASALIGNSRVSGVQKAIRRNPDALDNWNIAQNVYDALNLGTSGFINRISPTQTGRWVFDVVTGNNPTSSWFGNNGVMPDDANPYLSLLVNGVLDLGTYAGVTKANNYLNGYKQIGSGASSDVYISNNPLKRKYVYKVSSTTPAEMVEVNNLPRVVPSEHIGDWVGGTHVYKQLRVRPINNPNLKDFTRLAKTKDYIARLFSGDTEMVFHNPNTDKVMLDLSGNWGIDKLGREVLYDAYVLPRLEYLSILKKGGKV